MKTTENTNTGLEALGFSLEITSGPIGKVDKEDWAHLEYGVTLSLKGRPVYSTEYKMGVGNVKVEMPASRVNSFTNEEHALFNAWKRNHGADFKDKKLQARVAEKLAKAQCVRPDLSGVLYSLLADGDAHFNSYSFDDWASEFGYDTDSRKAEKVFNACVETGRAIARNVPADVISSAREILSDY